MSGKLCASSLELELQQHGREPSMLRLVVPAKQASESILADFEWEIVSDGAVLIPLHYNASISRSQHQQRS